MRSVGIGLVGVVIISLLTAFNDYALNNTFLIGNNLPIAAIVLLFLVTLLINGPLSRLKSRHVLSSQEIAVAFSMVLVSCCVPSSGLIRYLPGALISPVWQGSAGGDFIDLFKGLGVPDWLFPTMSSSDRASWGNDPVVTGFFSRWPSDETPPYRAWIRPILGWGIFTFALWGALICLLSIVRRQWMENERLAFPLAQIELALVEQPRQGHYFNSTMGQISFWIACGGIFLIHGWNGLGACFPGGFAQIPLTYRFTDIFTEPPFVFTTDHLKSATIYFTVVGVTYFLSSSVAFSLWFFFLLANVQRMVSGSLTGDPTLYGQTDQRFGGLLAFGLLILWIGRSHWWLVIKQAFRGERPHEPRGRYLSYRTAFWGLVGCSGTMIGWMVVAGSDWLGALITVFLLLGLFLLIARIIAETGLVHGSLTVTLQRPWQVLSWMGFARPVSVETFYLTSVIHNTHFDFREPLSVYGSHAMRITDRMIFTDQQMDRDTSKDRRTGRYIIGAMILALLVAYPTSWLGMLWTEYRYAYTADEKQEQINEWGTLRFPRALIMNETTAYAQQNYNWPHHPALHLLIGFGVTALLGWFKLQWSWWPLHPIGFLMIGTFPGNILWFSLFLGWLCKVLVLRFGGSSLYARAKPFFIGMLVGEAVAAGFWLILNLCLATLGQPYQAVRILPW